MQILEPIASPVASASESPVAEQLSDASPAIDAKENGWMTYARFPGANSSEKGAVIAKCDEYWARLAYEMDQAKRCPILETAEWIYHHLGTPPELIEVDDVPSPGALWHLRTLQESPAAAQEFLKTWMVKTIPDKKQMEFDGKKRLGSMKVFKALDEFDEQFAKGEAANAG